LCSSEGRIRRKDKIIPSALGELKSVSIARGASRSKTNRYAPNEHTVVFFVTYMMHFRTTPGPSSHFHVHCTQGYIITNQTTNLTARNNQLRRTQQSLPCYVAFRSSCPCGLRGSAGSVLCAAVLLLTLLLNTLIEPRKILPTHRPSSSLQLKLAFKLA
jgi:hypothetical protein